MDLFTCCECPLEVLGGVGMEQVELKWEPSVIDSSVTLLRIFLRDPSFEFGFYIGLYRCEDTVNTRRTNSLETLVRMGMLKKAPWYPEEY